MFLYVKQYLKFDSKIFIQAFFIFPFLVVFGTIFHELGHIVMAKNLGFETVLLYGSMSWFKNGIESEISATKLENFLVTLSGVLQTITTGTIGFLILKTSKKYFWLGIYLTLFWSREIINLVMSIFNGYMFNKPFFGGDEVELSQYFNFYYGSFSIILGVIGLFFCFYAINRIPINQRFSFLVSGFLSGIIAYAIWFIYLGPLLLP